MPEPVPITHEQFTRATISELLARANAAQTALQSAALGVRPVDLTPHVVGLLIALAKGLAADLDARLVEDGAAHEIRFEPKKSNGDGGRPLVVVPS